MTKERWQFIRYTIEHKDDGWYVKFVDNDKWYGPIDINAYTLENIWRLFPR